MDGRAGPLRISLAFCAAVLLWASAVAHGESQPPAAAAALQPGEATPAAGTPPAAPGGIIIVFTNTPTNTRTPTPVNIGNFVWDDLDGDGRQDASEPGVPGVTVQLWNSSKTALLDSEVTNASGLYTVTAPQPGNYRLRVLLPAGASFSGKDLAGGDDQLDSDFNPTGTNFGFTDIFTIASNVISTTIFDAGILVFKTPTPTRTPTPINVGNFVWHDLNENGVQDGGEPGVPFVTVQLWNSTKTALLDSDVTNGSGLYTLVAPQAGQYRVRVLLPTGASFTLQDNAANDQIDSDINPSGTNFGFTDIYDFGTNLISITTIDAGMTNVPPSQFTFTPTATNTRTPTATSTPTNTATPVDTPVPEYDQLVSLPLVGR
jgi:hypothetical protein